jgi:peptidoglycan/LPS O-acetylase OafA/YrhL
VTRHFRNFAIALVVLIVTSLILKFNWYDRLPAPTPDPVTEPPDQHHPGEARPVTTAGKNTRGLTLLATILIIAGIASLVYFLFFFDTSVAVPTQEFTGGGRVNNLGLLQDRQNGIIVSSVALMIGVIIAVAESLKKK